MVEIKSKKTGKTLLIGEIIKDTDKTIKLNTSPRIYDKAKIFIQYVIAIFLIITIFNCKTQHNNITASQRHKLKTTDSIAQSQTQDLSQEFLDDYHFNNDRDYSQQNERPDRDQYERE